MTKHHWRQEMKSLFERHADPDIDETLKKDMTEKKDRIIKLIKGEEVPATDVVDGETKLNRTLSSHHHLQDLVEDFHKQYQTLYDHYRSLTGELKKREDDSTTTSSSDSDSEADRSPKGGGKRNGKIETNDTLQQQQQQNNEILDLKHKVIALTNEKEKAQQRIESLEVERENWKREKEDMKMRLDGYGKMEAELCEKGEKLVVENDLLVKEKEGMIKRVNESEASLENVKATVVVLNHDKERLNTELETLKQEMKNQLQDAKNLETMSHNDAHPPPSLTRLENDHSQLKTKVDEMTREPNESSNDKLVVAELQKTIEYLKHDIEEERAEIFSIEEKNRTLEFQLRLSNQKVRITEQLLSEKEDIHRSLEKKNFVLSETIKAYEGMVKDISTQVNDSLTGFELSLLYKFDKDYKELSIKMLTMVKEIQELQSWVRLTRVSEEKTEKKIKEDKGSKIERLEDEVGRGIVEKEELGRGLKVVEDLGNVVKEKDERLMCLAEEKREAIRQLCLMVEYQRNRCEEMKRAIRRSSKVQKGTIKDE